MTASLNASSCLEKKIKFEKLTLYPLLFLNFKIHIRKRPKFVRKPPEGGSGTARSDGTDVSTQLESPSDRVKLEMGGPRVLACYCADGLYYPGTLDFFKQM